MNSIAVCQNHFAISLTPASVVEHVNEELVRISSGVIPVNTVEITFCMVVGCNIKHIYNIDHKRRFLLYLCLPSAVYLYEILIIPFEHLKDALEPAAVRYHQIKYIPVMLQASLLHQYQGQFLN